MSMDSYYTQTIVIQRKGTATKSALNADVATFATHLTISGRIRPLSGREQAASMRDNVFSTHRLYCAVADIKAGDQAVYDSVTYEVNYPSNPMNMGQHMQIDMSVKQS